MDPSTLRTSILARAWLPALSLTLLVGAAPALAQGGGWPGGQGGGGGWPGGQGGNGGGWPGGQGGNGGGGMPGFGGGEQAVNLGALGLGVEPRGAELEVKVVHDPSPAGDAGVRRGDVIVGVAGRRLRERDPGPVLQVIEAVEEAEGSRRRKPVVLVVERGGEQLEIEVRVERLDDHSRKCPDRCDKCEDVVRAGLEFLARTQAGDGSFPTQLGGKTGMVVVTSLGGLAFLAAGVEPERGNPLEKALGYVMNHVGAAESSPFGGGMGGGGMGGGNWNQENWELGYGLMFLAEMARITRRRDVLEKCRELVAKIEANQEPSGGWAHGPGGPNALGYVELEIVGNYLLTGLGAARRLELEVDEARLEKALSWIEGTSPGDGGVGYSQRDGQRHGDPGRTAGALVAFHALGAARHPFYDRMAAYYERNMGGLPGGHVSPAMHLLAGAMAARIMGRRAWDDYMDTYRLHIMQHRRPDGSFAATPTEESRAMRSNTDVTVGPRWLTATYVLILSMAEAPERLPLIMGEEDGSGGGWRSGRRRTGR